MRKLDYKEAQYVYYKHTTQEIGYKGLHYHSNYMQESILLEGREQSPKREDGKKSH